MLALGSTSLSACLTPEPELSGHPFALGIASGDPAPDGVVLWTKITSLPPILSVEMPAYPVRWEIANDDSMKQIVQSGEALAHANLGHSVHVEVTGLDPARDYFYRFRVGGEVSQIGRTRTAPLPGAPVDRLRFAVCGCQRREDGHYTALKHLAGENVDFVYFYGDYIYEPLWRKVTDFLGQKLGWPISGPPHEFQTLAYYRDRYTLYKADPDLQAAHASAPFIMALDDHEVDNNWAAEVDRFGTPPELFLLQRAAAFQAYYEMLPLRRRSMPKGPDMRLFRRFNWGSLADIHVLDTRQYRSDQPCGDGRQSREECPESLAPERTMLGPEQERWLTDGLGLSTARWNILAQQVMMMQHDRSNREGRVQYHMDKWDGAVDARNRLLGFVQENGIENLMVLTGDVHDHWAGDLMADFNDPGSAVLGHEIVATSITSGGNGSDHLSETPTILSKNPHIKFFNTQRGYVICEVTPSAWTTHYRVVDYVSRPGAAIKTRKSLVVEAGKTGLHEA